MARDSMYGEVVLWSGQPRDLGVPIFAKAAGLASYGIALVCIAFAVVQALVLGQGITAPLLLGLWCATLGATFHIGPSLWLRHCRYTLTSRHVICRMGPFRRTMECASISYARICWSPRLPGVGTLELIRAVPTGALRRRLLLRLEAIESPDGVWAIMRGAQDVAARVHRELPLIQRLDRNERILWAGRPRPHLRAYLPDGVDEWALSTAVAALLGLAAFMAVRSVHWVTHLARHGLGPSTVAFWALLVGLALGLLIVLAVAGYLAHETWVLRARTLHTTRYWISNQRVLIQRGREELLLDRRRVVHVIDTPAGAGTRNVFLVLDGPRARALEAGGAFGTNPRGSGLRPVFLCVPDGEGACRALEGHPSLPPSVPNAA